MKTRSHFLANVHTHSGQKKIVLTTVIDNHGACINLKEITQNVIKLLSASDTIPLSLVAIVWQDAKIEPFENLRVENLASARYREPPTANRSSSVHMPNAGVEF